jgi:hypothetical protein
VTPGDAGAAGDDGGGSGGSGGTSGTGGSAGTTTAGSGGSQSQNNGGEGGEAPMGAGGDMGTAGGGPDCALPADCDDDNACTIDSCNTGTCYHLPNQGPCEDDQNSCTTDFCSGIVCTHPSNGTCACQTPEDCDDSNPCTNDSCDGNKCVYVGNTDPCADDGDSCTDDVCMPIGANLQGGVCSHPDNGTCLCEFDSQCDDTNPCTVDDCTDEHQCSNMGLDTACTDDGSPCTDDKCDPVELSCKHPDKGLCAAGDPDLILIRANRTQKYVVINATFLEHTAPISGLAEVFQKVEEANDKFKLLSLSTGNYVTLGANDQLEATADLAGATVFSAPPCGTRRGLRAGNDNDGTPWVQARDPAVDGRLASSNGSCSGTGGSWEQFDLIPVGGVCMDPLDCDDGNDCTSETCNANGSCEYTDLTTACTDDADSCTDDVCDRGACTHKQNGSCAGTTVKIKANRNGLYIVLNAMFLEYTGANFAAGEEFELVSTYAGEFRLRAGSSAQFVQVDATENLIANTDYAGATIFSSPVCGARAALVAETDNDTVNYLKADAANRVLANESWCDPGNGSWEQFLIEPSP